MAWPHVALIRGIAPWTNITSTSQGESIRHTVGHATWQEITITFRLGRGHCFRCIERVDVLIIRGMKRQSSEAAVLPVRLRAVFHRLLSSY